MAMNGHRAIAWKHGYEASKSGLGRENNPYIEATTCHSAWYAGWLAEKSTEGDRPDNEEGWKKIIGMCTPDELREPPPR